MKIKYSLTRNEQRHSLTVEDAQPEILSQIMFMMTGSSNAQATTKSEPVVKRTADEIMAAVKEKQTPIQGFEAFKPEINRSADKIVHQEHSSLTTIADRLEEDETTEMYHIPDTSVRIVNRPHEEDIEMKKISRPT
ncbi:hypothetical protein ACQR3P_28815 [Rhodococcus sp. IEGM1300]